MIQMMSEEYGFPMDDMQRIFLSSMKTRKEKDCKGNLGCF